MDDAKADSTLLFINTTVEVVIADYDIDSETIRQSGFEAIFIDGDYYEEDSIQLVTHFCSHLFNNLPVVLFAKDEELRRCGLVGGARACSRLPLESLIEETFDVLFGGEVDADLFQKYLVDLIQYQEDRAQQNVHDSLHLSLHGKGFDKENSAATHGKKDGDASSLHSKSRNFVAVESKSHSLVGTLHFIAPEVIRLRKYGKAVDWWACGITFYECLVRKHLFAGDDKRVVFDNIMNAPIVLDQLAPFGEPITNLVRGLLNRDIRRRLGSQSIGAIKSQKVFEKIDWANIHSMNPMHKPAQFVNRKFRSDDRDLFFGPTTDHDISLRPENLEMRNTTSMQKYLLSKKRAKMRGNSNSRSGKGSAGKIGRLSTQHNNSASANANGAGGKRRSDRSNIARKEASSRSLSNSLDYQEEMIPEQEDEEAAPTVSPGPEV
jgi:serine/threonine protein kinase